MSVKQRFASAVFHAREKMGITQEQAAEALKISARWYQQLEYGHVLPSAELTLKIIAFYGINGESLREYDYVDVQLHSR